MFIIYLFNKSLYCTFKEPLNNSTIQILLDRFLKTESTNKKINL